MPTPPRSSPGSRVGSGLRSRRRRARRAASTTMVSAPDAVGRGARGDAGRSRPRSSAGRPLHRIGVVYRQREPYARLLDEELAAGWHPDARARRCARSRRSVAGRTLLGALGARRRRLRSSVGAALDERGADSVQRRAAEGRRRWARTALRAGVVRGPDQWTDRLGRACDRVDDQAPLLAEYVAWLVDECGVDERESWAAWADWAARVPEQGCSGRPRRDGDGPRPSSRPTTRSSGWSKASVRSSRSSRVRSVGRRPRRTSRRCWRCLPVVGARSATECSAGRCATSWASTSTSSSSSGWPRVTSRPTGVESTVLSASERDADRVAVRAAARGRETSAARTSLRSRRRRVGGCSRPRAAAVRSRIEAPWLADAPQRATRSRSSRSTRSSPTDRAGRVVARARPPRAASGARAPHSRSASPRRARTQSSRVGSPRSQLGSSDAFTEWEGNVGEHAELAIADTLLSATSLQTWAGCPARYFFKQRAARARAGRRRRGRRARGPPPRQPRPRDPREARQRAPRSATSPRPTRCSSPLDTFSWTVDGARGRRAGHREVLDEFERRGSRALRDPLGRSRRSGSSATCCARSTPTRPTSS